jgi:murein DD-endopeptidase MepM/ murein hydrolase activator NlpD
MYKRILNSGSKILAFYFVISFLILFVVSTAHHKVMKKIHQIKDLEREDQNIAEHLEKEDPDATKQNPISVSNAQQPFKIATVNPGDTIVSIFEQFAISPEDTPYIVKELTKILNPRKITTGSEITVRYTINAGKINFDKIDKIEISTGSNLKYEVINLGNHKFQAKKIATPLDKYFVKKDVTLGASFINSVTAAGVPKNIALSLVKVLSYDIDFQRDIKQGDKFEVLYDKFYNQKGKFSHNGAVQYASLKLKDRKIEIYRHLTNQGDEQFYNKDGRSVVKSLLRTPLNAAKISSKFGMRTHPVHGYSKMHKGVDFAASIGTPILAAGNGVVEFKGIQNGYGNFLKIRHNNIYSTAYAHISKFASGIKIGSKVRQGQVVAYVGRTGVTTGAHLHFELHKHGVPINPQSVKSTSMGEKLNGNELKKLKTTIAKLDNIIKQFNNKQTELKVSSLEKSLGEI